MKKFLLSALILGGLGLFNVQAQGTDKPATSLSKESAGIRKTELTKKKSESVERKIVSDVRFDKNSTSAQTPKTDEQIDKEIIELEKVLAKRSADPDFPKEKYLKAIEKLKSSK